MQVEDPIKILNEAKEKGAIKDWKRETSEDLSHCCREFYIEGIADDHYIIEWYINLMTLKHGSFEVWFDDIDVNGFHPGYKIAMQLSYRREVVAHLGLHN